MSADRENATVSTFDNDQLAAIMKDGLLPTFIADEEGQIVFWSRGMVALTMLPEDEALSQTLDSFAPDWPDLLLETAAARIFEAPVTITLGEKTHDLYLSSYRRRIPGQGSLCVVHLVDLSRRRQHEERQLHQQRMESLGRLAGGIAHDFNNILTIIRGNALVLRNDNRLPESHHSVSESIIKATQKGAAMINRLLTFSKPQPFTPFPVSVQSLIDDTLALVRSSEWDMIKVHSTMEPDLPPILGEPNRLSQVMVNLFVNARDAMPEGGDLFVHVGKQNYLTPSDLPAEGVEPGSYISISVRDTGTGMPREVVDRIFEPFFTTKSSGKGTGLGLPNVHTIIRQHSGWVDVESSPGKGSTFTLHLPVANEGGSGNGQA